MLTHTGIGLHNREKDRFRAILCGRMKARHLSDPAEPYWLTLSPYRLTLSNDLSGQRVCMYSSRN